MGMNELAKEYPYDKGYISLPSIDLSTLPSTITVNGQTLHVKSEFHISLVCVYRLAEMLDASQQEAKEKEIVQAFADYTTNHSLTDYKLLPEYRLVKRDKRVTVVVMAEVPGLADFFTFFSQKFGKDFPPQVAHITLYTLQSDAGIGIISADELQHDSEVVDVPELQDLTNRLAQ